GDARNQPLTFSECVGSFTGSSGEFNLVRSKQLGPALGWIGNTETPREDALSYQSFMLKQGCGLFRRMRPENPHLSGLMPFTILFSNWSGIASFEQMKPKPAMTALRTAYQPVRLSWELWTPQVYAGTEIVPIAHVINDDELGRELRDATIEFHLRSKDGRDALSDHISIPALPYYGAWSKAIPLKIPADLATGDYVFTGEIIAQSEKRSSNFVDLFIADSNWKQQTSQRSVTL